MDVKELVTQVVLDRARIIVHMIVVNQIVMERVPVVLWLVVQTALVKEPTLVVNVVADVTVGVGVAPADAVGAKVTAYPIVLVPPIQDLVENTV